MITITADSRAITIRFLLIDEISGRGKTGLSAESDGLLAASIRDGDETPTQIALRHKQGHGHVQGGFREVDAQLLPGLYEVDLAEELAAKGAHRAVVMIQAPGVIPAVMHLDLVAYDPYDGYRLGLESLTRESRHEVIARAFREVVPEIVEEFRRGS
jgi:hypothetical protein